MKDCKGVFGRVFGHKFVHVITKGAVRGRISAEGNQAVMLAAIEAGRDQDYHGIYCARCGEVIKK